MNNYQTLLKNIDFLKFINETEKYVNIIYIILELIKNNIYLLVLYRGISPFYEFIRIDNEIMKLNQEFLYNSYILLYLSNNKLYLYSFEKKDFILYNNNDIIESINISYTILNSDTIVYGKKYCHISPRENRNKISNYPIPFKRCSDQTLHCQDIQKSNTNYIFYKYFKDYQMIENNNYMLYL